MALLAVLAAQIPGKGGRESERGPASCTQAKPITLDGVIMHWCMRIPMSEE